MIDEISLAGKIYDAVLARGEAGRDAFYDALRAAGIAPTPADEPGHLYAPNPVVCPRSIVRSMIDDLNRFCEIKRTEAGSAEALLAAAPLLTRTQYASKDVAARLSNDLRKSHPLACLDAYLTDEGGRLDRAYLEWQTFPAYIGIGLKTLSAADRVFPEIRALGGSLFFDTADTPESVKRRMAAFVLAGIDDPKTGVIIDWEPAKQETRREFYALQDITGGKDRGFGVIDPREIRYRDGRPYYRRDARWTPIRAAASRLVTGDLEKRLDPALTADERPHIERFFADGQNVHWIVHPLHFTYGSKRDFPEFYSRKASTGLVRCEFVDASTIERAKTAGLDRLVGRVQKPIDGHGGKDVEEDPRVDELALGSILQDVIRPAAWHRTLAGPRVPEIRVMGIPDGRGTLESPIVFTRVKAPNVFRSNAGVTARANAPGTGEGYAVIA